jgi:hypothetical protein
MTIKIFCYIGAILFSTRVFLWIVCEVKKEDSYDGMNFAELKAEVNRLHQHHMQREKRR